MNREIVEHAAGGKGHLIKEHLLTGEQLLGKNEMYAKATLEPGCSLGYHVHERNAEAYYVLSGEGEYNDNGVIRTIKAGDVTYTPPGSGHSVENKGSEDLVFIALIIKN